MKLKTKQKIAVLIFIAILWIVMIKVTIETEKAKQREIMTPPTPIEQVAQPVKKEVPPPTKAVSVTVPKAKPVKTVAAVKETPLIAGVTYMATVTKYSGIESCTNAGCHMASGKKAYVGAVACPSKIPLGTKVKIFNRVYTCEDRTSASLDGRYDIFTGYTMDDYHEAMTFGIKQALITVIK